jgi:hypothetical protein
VHQSVAIHHDLDHVHSMVTRRLAGVLCPVDRLVLIVNAALAPSSVSSSVRAALVDPH